MSIRSLATLAATLLLGATPAFGQSVESLFPAGPTTDGFYVARSDRGKLEVGLLADLQGERPVRLAARVLSSGRIVATKAVSFDDDLDLFKSGRRGTTRRDEWFLSGFRWIVSCNADGSRVAFDGEVVGPSPAEFTIEIGVVQPTAEGEPLVLRANSTATTSKKFVLCGELAPLPKP